MPEKEPLRAPLENRADELLAQYQEEGWEQLLTALGESDIHFHCGFPEEIRMDSSAFLRQGPASQLFTLVPIRTLHLRLSQPEDILAIAASEQLQNLATLDLSGNDIGDAGALALAGSPHLRNLTTLNLRGNHGSPRLIAAIESRIEGRRTAKGCAR